MKIQKKITLHSAATAIIVMACLLIPGMCSAQSDAWTWMNGSDQIDQPGDYGTQGVPNAANVPRARRDGCSVIDSDGDLWLFGGTPEYDRTSYPFHLYPDLLNDLWNYDSETGEWTWMNGSNGVNQWGSYAVWRAADPANMPGARRGAVCWIDKNDDIWVFGGEGLDSDGEIWACHEEWGWTRGWLNDMWRYDVSANQWSWEDGWDNMTKTQEKGIYDDQGYPQWDHRPGAREGAIGWTDSNGYMWMFGGYGWQYLEYFEDNDKWCWDDTEKPCEDCPDPGVLNDLWVWNRLTNEWTWVSGSDDVDQLGSYGTKGEATFNNMPGGRLNSISWIDKDDNLWLFGGAGKDSIGPVYPFIRRTNDLWRYETKEEKKWTWMSGENIGDNIGIYRIDETTSPDASLVPGCREEAVSWIDEDGHLWLHGGFGQAGTYSPIGGLLNDLWRYDIGADEWSWRNGSDEIANPNTTSVAGVYGTKGVADSNNVTGAREGSAAWIDGRGELWLFGGWGFDAYEGYGAMNDMWRFGSTACVNDADCDDSLYCTGTETCLDGVCVDGVEPCSGNTPFCDETAGTCIECESASDCDDGLFCTGDATCDAGVCVDGTNPCIGGPDPVCDEAADICVAIECEFDSDCDDGLFCNGEELCVDDLCVDVTGPCEGDTPVCDETGDVCVTGCLDDSDCDDVYYCQNEVCVPKCRLLIKHKKLKASKLTKDKKVTFKITTGSFGEVDMGPDIEILEVKPNTKKGKVKVKTIVSAGLLSQTIPVWVGDCYGEVVILDE